MSLYDEHISTGLDRLLALSGRRGYLIGNLHGEFPNLGHHLPGEMGGLWSDPIKLADGFWFGLSAADDKGQIAWMHGPSCKSFRMQPGRAERHFTLDVNAIPVEAVQRLFIPEHETGLLAELTMRNNSAEDARLTLRWLVRWDIQ